MAIASAACCLALGAVPHLIKTFFILVQPMAVAFECHLQHVEHPLWKLRVQSVVNPLPLPASFEQPAGAQLSQVA
ncbi:hypothetical protein D3C72_2440700 [compost metagenome]